MTRTRYIDSLRGIAILFMILAHTIPNDTHEFEKVSFIIRLLSSLAAPLFLFLVGFNFKPKEKMTHQLCVKILLVFGLAVIVDCFLWQIIPFYSFDILYLIGLSIIALHLISLKSKLINITVIIVLLLGSFFYQVLAQYAPEVHELTFLEFNEFSITEMFRNLLFDGWFPIFPWLTFPILGYFLKSHFNYFHKVKLLYLIIPLFFGLAYLEYLSPSMKRYFSLELFYPADILYLSYAMCFIFISILTFKFIQWKRSDFLQIVGQPSLFIYVFHLFVIHWSFSLLYKSLNLTISVVYTFYVIFFIFCSYLISLWKNSHFYPKNSIILGFLMGK